MFKLQHYLLILTFYRVYKNQKEHYQNYWRGEFAPLSPPMATALDLTRSSTWAKLPAGVRMTRTKIHGAPE